MEQQTFKRGGLSAGSGTQRENIIKNTKIDVKVSTQPGTAVISKNLGAVMDAGYQAVRFVYSVKNFKGGKVITLTDEYSGDWCGLMLLNSETYLEEQSLVDVFIGDLHAKAPKVDYPLTIIKGIDDSCSLDRKALIDFYTRNDRSLVV